MRVYQCEFSMLFRGDIEANSREEAEAKLAAIGTGDVWDDPDWLLDETCREVLNGYEVDEEVGSNG